MRSGRCMPGIAEQVLLSMSPVRFPNWHIMEVCDIQPPRIRCERLFGYGGEFLQWPSPYSVANLCSNVV